MKKILILILLLILGWAGSTWFIGNKTEELLSTYIQQSEKSYADMGMDAQIKIKDYKKSFLQSTAKTSFSLKTGDPILDGLLKDIQFNNTITHGPILLADGTPSFGTALIHSTLDMDALAPEAKEFLAKAFADKNPLTSTMTFGLDKTAHYTISIPAVDLPLQDGKSSIKLQDGIQLAGIINKDTLMGTLKGTIGGWDILLDGEKFTTSASTIDVNMTGIVAGQMIGTTAFSLPSVNAELSSLPEAIKFGIDMVTNTQKSGEKALQGDMSLNLSNIKAPVDVSDINFNSNFKGFQIKGLEQLADAQKELQKLQTSAINSNISEAEQQALITKLKALPALLTSAVQNTLKKDETHITVKLDISSSQGKALLNADTLYVGNGVDIDIEKIAAGGLAEIMKILEGKFNFSAPKKMINTTPAALMMPMFTENGLIAEDKDKYSISTQFKGDTITLNGKTMTADEFITLMDSLKRGGAPAELEQSSDTGLPDAIPEALLKELSKQSIEELIKQGVPEEVVMQVEAFKSKNK